MFRILIDDFIYRIPLGFLLFDQIPLFFLKPTFLFFKFLEKM